LLHLSPQAFTVLRAKSKQQRQYLVALRVHRNGGRAPGRVPLTVTANTASRY
jgi:hypothetical protein